MTVNSLNIGVLLFEDVELLDYAGPYEVFSVATKIQNEYGLNIFTVGVDLGLIKSWNNVSIMPDYSIESHPKIDLLVIPGGIGTKVLLNDSIFMKWLEVTLNSAQLCMGVCSSTRLFAKLGVLKNKLYCTHHSVYDELISNYPTAVPQKNKRFVKSTKTLYTSAGVSAGIDLALHLLKKVTDSYTVQLTASYMEYTIDH